VRKEGLESVMEDKEMGNDARNGMVGEKRVRWKNEEGEWDIDDTCVTM
jgi:hypothetical protein